MPYSALSNHARACIVRGHGRGWPSRTRSVVRSRAAHAHTGTAPVCHYDNALHDLLIVNTKTIASRSRCKYMHAPHTRARRPTIHIRSDLLVPPSPPQPIIWSRTPPQHHRRLYSNTMFLHNIFNTVIIIRLRAAVRTSIRTGEPENPPFRLPVHFDDTTTVCTRAKNDLFIRLKTSVCDIRIALCAVKWPFTFWKSVYTYPYVFL